MLTITSLCRGASLGTMLIVNCGNICCIPASSPVSRFGPKLNWIAEDVRVDRRGIVHSKCG